MNNPEVEPAPKPGIDMSVDALKNAHEIVDRFTTLIHEAAEVISSDPGADPLDVFDKPPEVRGDAREPDWTDQQIAQVRETAGQMGIGGEQDIMSAAAVQILEGGKPWKIESELELAGEASTIIFSASPNRIIGQDESDYLLDKYQVDMAGKSEYESAKLIAQRMSGYEPDEEETVMPFGYDINNDHQLVEEETGQLVKIGSAGDKDVMMLRIDRENYVNEEGKNKYRNQPKADAMIAFVSEVMDKCGDDESTIGFNTSNTYAANQLNITKAALSLGRAVDIGMYGRDTLASVRGIESATPTSFNQLPGSLHKMYVAVIKLKEYLDQVD